MQSQEASQQPVTAPQGSAEAAALQLAEANEEIYSLQTRLAQADEQIGSMQAKRAEFQERFNQMTLEWADSALGTPTVH